EVLETLLVSACETRQDRRALPGQDRDRLHQFAGKLRYRGQGVRALVVDPPGEQVLHGRTAAAIGDGRDGDPERLVQQRAGQVGGPARPEPYCMVVLLALI